MEENLRQRMEQMCKEKPTKSQKKLLEYFGREDARRAAHRSISEVAEELDIADATVLRFCRALGFAGYRDFRMALAAECAAASEGYLSELAQSFGGELRACGEHIDERLTETAAAAIRDARTVCCLGMGASFFVATAMHERLLGLGVASFCERDAALSELFIASRGPSDLLLVFGSDPRAARSLALARARGMRSVMVAGEPSARCDLTLIRAGEEDYARMLFAVEALALALEHTGRA